VCPVKRRLKPLTGGRKSCETDGLNCCIRSLRLHGARAAYAVELGGETLFGFNGNRRRGDGAGADRLFAPVGGEDGVSFRDWREGLFPEREFMVKETHARTGYPLPRYARISHMTRIFPSREDEFREHLARLIHPALPPKSELFGGKSPSEHRSAARDWYARLAAPIADLGPFNEPHTEDRDRRLRCVAEALAFIEAETPARGRHGMRQRALAEIAKLDSLFADGGPLAASAEVIARFKETHPHADAIHFQPYRPTGQERFRWFNFWRLDGGLAIERRLRMNWELFGGSQNFTVFEDFADRTGPFEETPAGALGPAPGGQARSILVRDPDGPLAGHRLNTEWTAIDTIQQELGAAFREGGGDGRFLWTGHLAVAANYWILPAEHLLEMIPGEEMRNRVRAALLDARGREATGLKHAEFDAIAEPVTRFAISVFHYPDKTAYGDPREDFVISRIMNGRGILISDLRPSRSDPGSQDMASRAIVFDISLTQEERGRVIRQFCDIASARTLAFRDFPYVDPIISAINAIGRGVSRCNSDILRVTEQSAEALWSAEAEAQKAKELQDREPEMENVDARAQLTVTLDRLRTLSVNLTTLNSFITHGISGGQSASNDYRRIVQERWTALDESPMGGFQTLDGFLRRFFNTAVSIDRMAARYDTLRRRIAEYSQLVRAEIELLELKALERQSRKQVSLLSRADVLAVIGISLGIISALQGALTDDDNGRTLALQHYLLIVLGSAGYITVFHALWKGLRYREIFQFNLRFVLGLLSAIGFTLWAAWFVGV